MQKSLKRSKKDPAHHTKVLLELCPHDPSTIPSPEHISKSFQNISLMTFELISDAIKDFFSSLVRGSQRGKKFLFQTEEFILEEREILGFNEVAYLKKTPRWFRI